MFYAIITSYILWYFSTFVACNCDTLLKCTGFTILNGTILIQIDLALFHNQIKNAFNVKFKQ